MEFDRNRVTPSGKTSAQIDAERAEYVRAANAALATVRDKDAWWSSYQASHNTFEILVGDAHAEDNIVLSMPACKYLVGPVTWPAQRIEVFFRCEYENERRTWEFEIRDETVGFRAVGEMFRWRRGYDLWGQGGLWFGRGTGPETPLTCEQAEEKLGKLLRHFYNGLIGYKDLQSKLFQILDQLPIVSGQPNTPGE